MVFICVPWYSFLLIFRIFFFLICCSQLILTFSLIQPRGRFSLVVAMSVAKYVCMYVRPLPMQFNLRPRIGQHRSHAHFLGLSLIFNRFEQFSTILQHFQLFQPFSTVFHLISTVLHRFQPFSTIFHRFNRLQLFSTILTVFNRFFNH